MTDRVWLVERTRVSTDYKHVTAYSAAAAMEIALESGPRDWLIRHGLADDPDAIYLIRPIEKSTPEDPR